MMAAGEECNFQPSCVTVAKLRGRGTNIRGRGTSPRSELTNCAMRLAQFTNFSAVYK